MEILLRPRSKSGPSRSRTRVLTPSLCAGSAPWALGRVLGTEGWSLPGLPFLHSKGTERVAQAETPDGRRWGMKEASQFEQKDAHLRDCGSWRPVCTAESIIDGQASLSEAASGKGPVGGRFWGGLPTHGPAWAGSHTAPRPRFPQQLQGTKSSGVILSSLPRTALKGPHVLLGLMITCCVAHRPRCQCVCEDGWEVVTGVAWGRIGKRPEENGSPSEFSNSRVASSPGGPWTMRRDLCL